MIVIGRAIDCLVPVLPHRRVKIMLLDWGLKHNIQRFPCPGIHAVLHMNPSYFINPKYIPLYLTADLHSQMTKFRNVHPKLRSKRNLCLA